MANNDHQTQQLDRIMQQLDSLTHVSIALARNEERLTALTENVAMYIARVDSMERDVYGPEGVIVQLARLMTKITIGCAILVALTGVLPLVLEKVM